MPGKSGGQSPGAQRIPSYGPLASHRYLFALLTGAAARHNPETLGRPSARWMRACHRKGAAGGRAS